MINFGYTINKSSRIDLDNNDMNITKTLMAKEPTFRLCIGCGCCTSTCSANTFTEFNLRKTQLLVNRGESKNLRKEIEKCMLCGKCQMVCPRGVNTRNVILQLFKVLE